MKWGVVHTGGSRCPGQLVWRAWKVKQLNDRLTAEISLCERCQFPLSTLVSWMVKTYTLKWQNSLSTARVIVIFIPQAPFPSLYNWSYMKGNCARKVASNLTQSHFLSYPSVIALDETCSRQHSRTCDGQTILSVSSSSGGGEERSSSPDIKLSYLFTASQMMPDNRNITLKYASLKIWWKGRQLVYSTPIIFGNGNELFMSPLDAMEIHDPWITLGKQNTSTRCSYMENEKEGESERRVVLRG